MSPSRAQGPPRDDTTATLVRGTAVPRPLGATVTVQGADAAPQPLHLASGSCVIGSAPGCDLVIRARTVSRQHVDLRLVPEGVLVKDLGSHNGTYYLGQRVEKMVMALGGRIQLGTVTVAIDLDPETLRGDVAPYPEDRYLGMVGPSLHMRRLFSILVRLEGSLVPVLVEGESGVGKELIAQALHQGSSVAGGPFVAVNCGAILPDLVASELFGHTRGAFTGAVDARLGAFVSADRGTLFLDEVGELPLPVQPMLLRVLETGEVRALGGDRVRKTKVRLIAATNRDLAEEVRAGRFREDLYYRLAVVRLLVPPLRERPEDIEALGRHFAHEAGLADIPKEIVSHLRARAWPGNARELRNVVQAYAALGTLPAAAATDEGGLARALFREIDVTRPYAEQKDAIVDRFTRLYLEALLAHTSGNQTLAADLAGLGRTYLCRLLHKHGLTRRTRTAPGAPEEPE